MQLTVRELMQSSSLGYVVKYSAEFDTVSSSDPVSATVANTIPDDADPELVELARIYSLNRLLASLLLAAWLPLLSSVIS